MAGPNSAANRRDRIYGGSVTQPNRTYGIEEKNRLHRLAAQQDAPPVLRRRLDPNTTDKIYADPAGGVAVASKADKAAKDVTRSVVGDVFKLLGKEAILDLISWLGAKAPGLSATVVTPDSGLLNRARVAVGLAIGRGQISQDLRIRYQTAKAEPQAESRNRVPEAAEAVAPPESTEAAIETSREELDALDASIADTSSLRAANAEIDAAAAEVAAGPEEDDVDIDEDPVVPEPAAAPAEPEVAPGLEPLEIAPPAAEAPAETPSEPAAPVEAPQKAPSRKQRNRK